MYLEGDKWKNWHTRENDGTVNENILRQCMINDSKKETDL